MIPAHHSQKSVFTIAVGDYRYLRMAFALARSFRRWNSPRRTPFILVTDCEKCDIPVDLDWLTLHPISPGEYGSGFSPKLYLDRLAPAPQSLFIDADCLCVGDLDPIFEKFAGRKVSAVGRMIADGEWFGDVAVICRRVGVDAMPRFNGGVYYLERGKTATNVYETARRLERTYDDIGFERLRGVPNDEVLVSAAMALHDQAPIPEDGTVMNSLLAGPGGVEVDVFKGHSLLKNPKSNPKYNPWYEREVMSPLLVHYVGCPVSESPYVDEVARIEWVCGRRIPIWFATIIARIRYTWPRLVERKLKNAFRPLFHRIFGVREVKGEKRF